MEVFQQVDFSLLRHVQSALLRRVLGRGFGQAYLNHAQLALGQVAKLDLFDGNSLTGAPMDGLVDGAECALAQALPQALR